MTFVDTEKILGEEDIDFALFNNRENFALFQIERFGVEL